jgi:hypothetical protein
MTSLGIAYSLLPPYSPHLTLRERVWKCANKRCPYSKSYAASASFQQAIVDGLAQAPTKDKAELASLLRWRFQTFTAVPTVGA